MATSGGVCAPFFARPRIGLHPRWCGSDSEIDEDLDANSGTRARPSCAALLFVFATSCTTTRDALRAYQAGDYEVAKSSWTTLASNGDPDAQFFLGLMHDEGRGTQADHAAASRWYELAAMQGHPAAQTNLGMLCFEGRGIAKDRARAIELYGQAAKADFAPAMANLGVLYLLGNGVRQNLAKSRSLLLRAANKDHAHAQRLLGWIYRKGMGVPVDPRTASRWYARASDRGDLESRYRLALLYLEDDEMEDESRAVVHMKSAADAGYAAAQYSLGLMHLRGRGVEKSREQAQRWIGLAAKQGLSVAQQKLEFFGGDHTIAAPGF